MIDSKHRSVVLVEDEQEEARLARMILEESYEVHHKLHPPDDLGEISSLNPCLVLLDWRLGKTTGLDLLLRLRNAKLLDHFPVVVYTAYDDESTKLEAMGAGASSFIIKRHDTPARVLRLLDTVIADHQKAHSVRKQRAAMGRVATEFLGNSPQAEEIRESIARKAKRRFDVLILGEPGVGKDVVARAIHAAANDPDLPCQRVSAPQFSPQLFRSEMFGHERGAFTGAEYDKIGIAEAVGHGDLIISDIGSIHADIQAKLLELLEERRFRPLSRTPIEKEFRGRIICTSNGDLLEGAKKGTFRKDLLGRLEPTTIHIPPLRKRPEDIIPIARRLVHTECLNVWLEPVELTTDAESYLASKEWADHNVRQLRNAITGALGWIEDDERFLGMEHFERVQEGCLSSIQLKENEEKFELLYRDDIAGRKARWARWIVGRYHGDAKKASRAGGIALKTLWRLLSRGRK